MKPTEEEFIEKCEKRLPKFIMVDNVKYKISVNKLMGWNTFRIIYVEFNGEKFNWDNKLIDLFYTICEVIPKKRMYEEGDIIDSEIYLLNLDEAITHCKISLDNFNFIILDEIISKETEFSRELTSLLNRFSKENGSNTPDFILSNYLSQCLRTFNNIMKQREEWYGK